MSSRPPVAAEGVEARVFTYPSVPAVASGAEEPGKPVWPVSSGPAPGTDVRAHEEREKQIRMRGFEEGVASTRAECEKQVTALRGQIAKALSEFAAERESYFQRVEQEVVQLTLAIARKVLHREAQMDPLVLMGVLRVALERVDAGTKTRLRVNPAEIHIWREYFLQAREKFSPPELIGDPELEPFRCVLETEAGTTEIGLETQLKEIEQGFLDLLSQKPVSG